MCVIIVRNPGIEIDPEKLTSACIVNADGYGISVVDRGKIETFKNYRKDGNDPKEVIKIFEDAKDQQVFAHLRFSTKGIKNLDNCHPFTILKDGDFEAHFMHNGTIYEFGDADRSDSREFAEEILAPTAEAFFKVHGSEWLDHPAFRRISEKYRPGGSVFTYYDSTGQHFSQGTGVQYEGWWASNAYSFNRSHRTPSSNTTTTHSNSWYNYYNRENREKDKEFEKSVHWRIGDYFNGARKEWGKWEGHVWLPNHMLNDLDPRANATAPFKSNNSEVKTEDKGKHLAVVPNTPAKRESTTSSTNATTDIENRLIDKLHEDCAAIGQAIHMAKSANLEPANLTPPEKRITFCEFAEIGNLEDVTMLDEEQLYEMVDRWPLASTMLLMDLIFELYSKKQTERIHEAIRKTGEAKQEEQKRAVNQ